MKERVGYSAEPGVSRHGRSRSRCAMDKVPNRKLLGYTSATWKLAQ